MSTDITSTVQPSRRTLLKTIGAVGVAGAGGVLSRQVFSPAIAAPTPKIRLAWTEVAACHSPLGFGVAKGIYAKHNLDVELFYQGASGQTLIQALATGKADAGAGLIGDWLKPLEQGFDVKLFVLRHLLMRGRGRVNGERAGVANIGDMVEKLERVDELAPCLDAALELEADEAAVAAFEIGIGAAAGLARLQAGEDDLGHIAAPFEEIRNQDRIFVVLAKPQRQRFEPLQKLEGVERRDRRADVAQQLDAGA